MDVNTMQAGRELDARIHHDVLNLGTDHYVPACIAEEHETDEGIWCYACNMLVSEQDLVPPPYSTDMAAAWQVVEAMKARGLRLSLDAFGGDPWWCEFADETWTRGAQAEADTAPLAICRAALTAVQP